MRKKILGEQIMHFCTGAELPGGGGGGPPEIVCILIKFVRIKGGDQCRNPLFDT